MIDKNMRRFFLGFILFTLGVVALWRFESRDANRSAKVLAEVESVFGVDTKSFQLMFATRNTRENKFVFIVPPAALPQWESIRNSSKTLAARGNREVAESEFKYVRGIAKRAGCLCAGVSMEDIYVNEFLEKGLFLYWIQVAPAEVLLVVDYR